MATALKNLSDYTSAHLQDMQDFKFGLVVAEWNRHITDALCKGAYDTLIKHGVKPAHIKRITVPGTFELTLGAQRLAQSSNIDAVICIGVVIKGETKHDEYISHAVAQGISTVNLKYDKPVIFGVLTTNNEEQALDRAGGKHGNKGVEAAYTAMHMLSI